MEPNIYYIFQKIPPLIIVLIQMNPADFLTN
jgi:hypothetical protein